MSLPKNFTPSDKPYLASRILLLYRQVLVIKSSLATTKYGLSLVYLNLIFKVICKIMWVKLKVQHRQCRSPGYTLLVLWGLPFVKCGFVDSQISDLGIVINALNHDIKTGQHQKSGWLSEITLKKKPK